MILKVVLLCVVSRCATGRMNSRMSSALALANESTSSGSLDRPMLVNEVFDRFESLEPEWASPISIAPKSSSTGRNLTAFARHTLPYPVYPTGAGRVIPYPYYPYYPHPLSRDGYNSETSGGDSVASHGSHYQMFPMPMAGWGWSDGGDDDDSSSSIGLLGLLGLKGLKGVKAKKALKGIALKGPLILIALAPILLPLFLILLLFLPIPVITVPTGRTTEVNGKAESSMSNWVMSMLQEQECIERLSCEIGRKVPKDMSTLITTFKSKSPSPNSDDTKDRIFRGFLSGQDDETKQQSCMIFHCDWVQGIKQTYNDISNAL